MAASNLLALIDDIASVLDDVALLTKVAAKKTAGVVADDLALNAEQVAGVKADRELPVVWAVAKGSLRNKAILVPLALAISAIAPWAVLPLLMIGGAFLCYEGFEKVVHRLWPGHGEVAAEQRLEALLKPDVDLGALEREKIKGAIRTDFILSAEIITITLGSIADASFASRVLVLSATGVVMTIGVYGLVAAIVKLDDGGLALSRSKGDGAAARALRSLGFGMLKAVPLLMKGLGVAGTLAMFLVGGGIVVHAVGPVGHLIDDVTAQVRNVPLVGGVLGALASLVMGVLVGTLVGALALGGVQVVRRLLPRKSS